MKINGKTIAIVAGVALVGWLLKDRLNSLISKGAWAGGL